MPQDSIALLDNPGDAPVPASVRTPATGSASPRAPTPEAAGPGPVALSVEITSPQRFATLEREWRDLAGRALEPNAFLEPGLVAAAAADAPIHVVLAWGAPCAGAPIRLAGAWALASRRPSSRLPVRVLKAPVHDHAYLGIPVLDCDAAADALLAMFEAIALEPSLPNLVEISALDADGPVAAAFAQALLRRGAASLRLEPRARPALRKATPGAGGAAVSASRSKALQQRRRRLARQGEVSWSEHRDATEIGAAVEEFLALEASGWKGRAGRRGRALRRAPAQAAFFRTALAALAARGRACITALRVDGRPAAMQITIRSGDTAFTWKSAYDEALRQCAPGLLLLRQVTDDLLADPAVGAADSCNHADDGYMAEFWAGRRAVHDMVLDVRPGRSAGFALLGAAESGRRRLLSAARRLRARSHGGNGTAGR